MPKGLFSKQNVPTGSTLHAKVSPTAAPPPDRWSADLFLRRQDGQLEAHFDNAALRAGVAQVLNGAGDDHYIGQLVLTFAGPSNAQVDLKITKPGGSPHGKVYSEVHSSAPADAVAIIIFMA